MCVVDSPKKWTYEFVFFLFTLHSKKPKLVRSFFGRIYDAQTCLPFYLTFSNVYFHGFLHFNCKVPKPKWYHSTTPPLAGKAQILLRFLCNNLYNWDLTTWSFTRAWSSDIGIHATQWGQIILEFSFILDIIRWYLSMGIETTK